MNLDLFNNVKNNKLVQSFIRELQNYLENNISKSENIEKEGILLNNNDKITTQYRDKMYIERAHILNQYAEQTLSRGKMYYIYDKNSKMADSYNLCICGEGNSHTVIEKSKYDLPEGAEIGSVLRGAENKFILDEETTAKITEEIDKMKDRLLNEQLNFLESKRVEGHTYELAEIGEDRAWLYDITSESEEIEEIDFPEKLLKDATEGDLFVYENGKYQKK